MGSIKNVSFEAGSQDFGNLKRRVCFQPFLRRLFGVPSFPTTTVAGAAKTGKIFISLPFAEKLLHISFVNLTRHEYGSYGIFAVSCGNNAVAVTDSKSLVIPRSMLEQTDEDEVSIILHIK